MDMMDVLQKKFGYESFRPGQKEVIEHVLSGQDTIAIFPTGMGKSLCYQLPGYLMDGSVLIISPLMSLMEDQVMQMRKNGEKRVIALNSFLTHTNRKIALNQLDYYKFIFLSPEMLSQKKIVERLKRIGLGLIVIDEAHCISQWGFDFRPDYLRIGEFLTSGVRPPILALTATADQKVMKDIPHYLHMKKPVVQRHSLDRKNISYSIVQLDSSTEKLEWIQERVVKTSGPGIIYTTSRKRTDELAFELQRLGISCQSYHAGKEHDDRSIIQNQFLNGELEWICATNAFGMGVHKENVRQVIHEHLPSTIADYSQEVGRAGRDGLQSIATLLYTTSDERVTSFIIQSDIPGEEEVRHYLNLLSQGTHSSEAALLASLTETGKRVIDYYTEQLPMNEVLVRLNAISEEKEIQLQRMLSLVQQNQCIRESLLSYFGEECIDKPEPCCSICGLPEMEEVSDVPTVQSTTHSQQKISWDERITKLLG